MTMIKIRHLATRALPCVVTLAVIAAFAHVAVAAVSDPVAVYGDTDSLQARIVPDSFVVLVADFRSDLRRVSAVAALSDSYGRLNEQRNLSPASPSTVVNIAGADGAELKWLIAYKNAEGEDIAVDTGSAYVLSGSAQPVDIRIDKGSREWSRIERKSILPYSADWAPFPGTNVVYTVRAGEEYVSTNCTDAAGWVAWDVSALPFSSSSFNASLTVDGELPAEFLSVLRPVSGFLLILK